MPSILRLVLPHGLLLAATVLLYAVASRIASNVGAGRIGPDAWPKAILVLMGALCAWEIVRRLATRPRGAAGADPGEGGTEIGRHGRLLAERSDQPGKEAYPDQTTGRDRAPIRDHWEFFTSRGGRRRPRSSPHRRGGGRVWGAAAGAAYAAPTTVDNSTATNTLTPHAF